jgi:hypothetical protein
MVATTGSTAVGSRTSYRVEKREAMARPSGLWALARGKAIHDSDPAWTSMTFLRMRAVAWIRRPGVPDQSGPVGMPVGGTTGTGTPRSRLRGVVEDATIDSPLREN